MGKHTSPALLFPAGVLEAIRKNEVVPDMDPAWTPVVREFISHYAAVIEVAHLLLGAAPFEGLGRLYDELKEDYTKNEGIPSLVYDSHLVQHGLGAVPRGIAGETPLSVLARLAHGDGARARLQELAQSLSSAHFDLYRVARVVERDAEVVPLRGGAPLELIITAPFLREGELVLARVVAFGGRRFLADPPYVLLASEAEWLDYLERVAAADAGEPSSSTDATARAKPKLTSKQAGRRRKELKAKAARNTASERVARHLHYGSSARFWLEYVMDAFAGVQHGIVRLAGVPDRPETLPHHADYDGPELDLPSDDEDDAVEDVSEDDGWRIEAITPAGASTASESETDSEG